jgi:hypothetical protein
MGESKLNKLTEANMKQEELSVDEEQLRIEFQQALNSSAEDRANSPFMVAAQTHHRMTPEVMKAIDNISGGGAKRILKYLCFFPFYVRELNPQDQAVEDLAAACDKLVNTKNIMALCVALEKEARTRAAIQEQEDQIMPMPEGLELAGREEMANNLEQLGLISQEQKEEVILTGQLNESEDK